MPLGRPSSGYRRQHSCGPAYKWWLTTSWRTIRACGSSDIVPRCAFPSRRTLWRGSRQSFIRIRWRASSVKPASGLSWGLGSNKSLGRHIRVTSSGRTFYPPLTPECVLCARRIKWHYGSCPMPVRSRPGNTRESLPMNRTSLAVLWMVSLQRLPAIGPAGERRPTLAS